MPKEGKTILVFFFLLANMTNMSVQFSTLTQKDSTTKTVMKEIYLNE